MVKNCNERLKWWVAAVATKVKSTHLLCWEKKTQNICFKCNFFPYICVLTFFFISVVLFYFKQSYAYSWLTIYQSYPYTYVNATRPINNYKSSVKKNLKHQEIYDKISERPYKLNTWHHKEQFFQVINTFSCRKASENSYVAVKVGTV